ncbi:MAG TPA: hypothetical protein VFI68_09240 [Anaerolineales bacterium]|nr:hypothetical protein [Anaerolineales bacterium]
MFSTHKRYSFAVVIFVLGGAVFFWMRGINSKPSTVLVVGTPTATFTPALIPKTIPIEDSPLKDSIVAAGDYLVRQQLPNGELSYQVDFMTDERSYTPSYIRLVAGAGSLFTVCRVSGDSKYCDAGDRALDHYLELLVSDPEHFTGTCLYTNGNCQLGGAALTVDAIYKRWQATGGFILQDRNLLATAIDLGYFIVSMRRPQGGFYHSFDPHFAGTADPDYFVIYFPGESLLALTEIYEMTGNESWLIQAREVNAYMLIQPVTEDHWHGYAFSMFARLDALSKADKDYGKQIADLVIEGQVRSLNPANTSISTATKIEALAALAQAFYFSGADHEWLEPEIRTFITFVRARQLPDNNCDWDINNDMMLKYGGGIFSSCEDASIRIDGVQHWINGVTAYLEYGSMIGIK